MTLKRKITADEFEALDKVLQKEYTEEGDDYILDAETGNDPNTDKLKRASDRLKQEKKDLAKQLKEANEKLAKLGDEEDDDDDPPADPAARRAATRKVKDIEKLTKAHDEKIAELEAEKAAALEKANARVTANLITSTANAMATEISSMPKLMSKEIRERLTVKFDDDGEPELVVMKDGKESNLSLEQLKKEIVANKEFAGIIIASKASGGGATRRSATDPKTASGSASVDDKPVDWSKASPKDLAAHAKRVKEASTT